MNPGGVSKEIEETSWQARSLPDTHSCQGFPNPPMSRGHILGEAKGRASFPDLCGV